MFWNKDRRRNTGSILEIHQRRQEKIWAAKENPPRKAKEELQNKIGKEVSDKVGDKVGDKAKSEIEKAKDKLKKYDPFKKK